jgi:hypothetical protein
MGHIWEYQLPSPYLEYARARAAELEHDLTSRCEAIVVGDTVPVCTGPTRVVCSARSRPERAADCAQTQAVAFREAAEAIHATLTAFGVKPGTDAATEALKQAAEPFATDDLDAAQWYYPDALRVLVLQPGIVT